MLAESFQTLHQFAASLHHLFENFYMYMCTRWQSFASPIGVFSSNLMEQVIYVSVAVLNMLENSHLLRRKLLLCYLLEEYQSCCLKICKYYDDCSDSLVLKYCYHDK